MASKKTSVQEQVGVRWHQSLLFKLGLLFLATLAILAAAAYWSSRTLVRDKLRHETSDYEQETGRRLTAELRTLFGDSENLALTLSQLINGSGLSLDDLRSAGPDVLRNRPLAPVVAAIGIWPEPGVLPGAADRASLLWLRDGSGKLQARTDYNDPKAAPYSREKWYTPARYLREGAVYWAPARKDPLLNREVLTAVTAMHAAGRFAGVVTISLDLRAVQDRFARLAGGMPGYSVLVDGNLQIIGLGRDGSLEALGHTGESLADVAKRSAGYQPLSLALYKAFEARKSAVLKSSAYDARAVSTLKDASREMSRQEAEDALLGIWNLPAKDDPVTDGDAITEITADPVLSENSAAAFYALQAPPWTLIRVTSAEQGGSDAATYAFKQSVVVTLGLTTLALVLAFAALRGFVIRPLRLMARQLARSQTPEDALNLVLDASSRDEVGMLAHWQNERIRQLRDAMDSVRAAQTQLSSESRERKSAQEALSRARERAALALQSVSDAVLITDERGVVEDMNAAAETLCGITLREARNKPLPEIARVQRSDLDPEAANPARLAIERGNRIDWQEDVAITPHNGHTREIVLNASAIRARNQVVGAVVVLRERLRREAASQDVAGAVSRHQQDLLTGLPGRAALDRRLATLIDAVDVSYAAAYVDVDHLKRINDAGGLAAGDDVLVRVTETLQQASPAPHEVYRIAADQFVVVYGPADAEAARTTAETLRERVSGTRFYWESKHFSTTVSVGVSLTGEPGLNPVELVRRADDACAAAKRAGRNNVQLYDPRMDRLGRTVDDEVWIQCIRQGLTDNLFHLRTQWIMPGKDYAAEGHCYEVLVALEDSEGFWASPAAFMPVAERHHLTTGIDRWVIRNTLDLMLQQPQLVEGLAFCSINLSTGTLASPDFLDFIAGALEDAPQLAGKLCFELREDALTDHQREAALCCEVLHRMGCKISVDHYFGRHISELTQLRTLPVDFVKVDAQGFKNLGSDPVEQMLAESILRIVRHLRRRVIVNNIDDAKMLETWRKLGADYFQGYAFAKPSPVAFLAPS